MNVDIGSNVTTPVAVSTVYTPSAVVTLEAEQFDVVNGDTADVGHKRTLDTTTVAPEPAVSLPAGVYVWLVSNAPDCTSALAVGGGTTVGVIAADAVPEPSETWYLTAVACPAKAVVHGGLMAGVFEPLHGVKVTTPEAFTEYLP